MATKHENGTLEIKEEQQLKAPPMYQVLLLNDDYTPMEFVVAIIQEYFNKGMCGVYPKDSASTKVELVLTHAGKAGHPLQCVMEEV
jgi:ATP-dependent Clp protease adaptor protein ClpS